MNNKLLVTIIFSAGLITLASCEKKLQVTAIQEDLSDKSFVRVIHGMTSLRQLYNASDSINIFSGASKINAGPLTFSNAFPVSTSGYFAVPAGEFALRVTSQSGTNPDARTLATLNKSLVQGNYYTLLLTDSLTSSKDSLQIWTRDSVPRLNPGFTGLRFIHGVLNDTASKNVDVYSARRNGVLFPNVKPGTVTNFISTGIYSGVADTLIIKRTTTNFELARIPTVSFTSQRNYTLIYRGHADSSGTRRYARNLVITAN